MFNSFIKESVANKGKGPGNNDLFLTAPKKQTINQSNQTVDFLRLGKQIKTSNIDGFIDSIQDGYIYIIDRITGLIDKYTLKEVLKELGKYKPEKISSTVQGFEGIPAWAQKQKIYESIEDIDREFSMEDISGVEIDPEDDDEDIDDDEYDYSVQYSDDEEDIDFDLDDNSDEFDPESNQVLYGTEDNPEGIPNKGDHREMPNESWVKHWEKFDQKSNNKVMDQMFIDDDDDDREYEYEVPIIRGTEDNPLPSKKRRRPKIESYD